MSIQAGNNGSASRERDEQLGKELPESLRRASLHVGTTGR